MPQSTMKLTAKLIFVPLLIIVTLTAIGSYVSVRRAFQRVQDEQEQMARAIVEQYRGALINAWRANGNRGLFIASKNLESALTPYEIRWVWFEQMQSEGGPVVQQLVFGSETVLTRIELSSGQRRLHTYHVVELGAARKGGLELTCSLDAYDDRVRYTVVASLVSLGLLSLGAISLVYIAGVRLVASPLEKLIGKTEEIARGEFGNPLDLSSKDEFGQLAEALNRMSEQLAQQRQQLQQEAEERLATVEQLRHADRLKTVGRLAAGLAHELGTPLNVISGRADLISSGRLPDGEVASSAKTIKGEADRVTAIMRSLLDFARPPQLQKTTLDLNQIVRETIELLKPLADKNNATIEFESQEPLTVYADRAQLQQVFTNLIVNAMQSMPNGGAVNVRTETAATTDLEKEGDFVRVEICDQGVGISNDHLDQIFEPFFTTKDVGQGTGLGLSIVHGIVEEHDGRIDVTSEQGKGSCFRVSLPQGGEV